MQTAATRCFLRGQRPPRSRTRGKTAGNRRSFVEAGGGKDLAEQGLVAINIGGAGEGKTKETGTEGSGGREGEQGGPTGSEGSNGCRPQRSRHSTGPAASEEANESAPLRAHQLRVSALLRPCVRCEERRPGTGAGAGAQRHSASCAPPQSGSPFAMTSMRRSSRRSG